MIGCNTHGVGGFGGKSELPAQGVISGAVCGVEIIWMIGEIYETL